jgi:hypothetical protein
MIDITEVPHYGLQIIHRVSIQSLLQRHFSRRHVAQQNTAERTRMNESLDDSSDDASTAMAIVNGRYDELC